jgi:hypothetical protein
MDPFIVQLCAGLTLTAFVLAAAKMRKDRVASIARKPERAQNRPERPLFGDRNFR